MSLQGIPHHPDGMVQLRRESVSAALQWRSVQYRPRYVAVLSKEPGLEKTRCRKGPFYHLVWLRFVRLHRNYLEPGLPRHHRGAESPPVGSGEDHSRGYRAVAQSAHWCRGRRVQPPPLHHHRFLYQRLGLFDRGLVPGFRRCGAGPGRLGRRVDLCKRR